MRASARLVYHREASRFRTILPWKTYRALETTAAGEAWVNIHGATHYHFANAWDRAIRGFSLWNQRYGDLFSGKKHVDHGSTRRGREVLRRWKKDGRFIHTDAATVTVYAVSLLEVSIKPLALCGVSRKMTESMPVLVDALTADDSLLMANEPGKRMRELLLSELPWFNADLRWLRNKLFVHPQVTHMVRPYASAVDCGFEALDFQRNERGDYDTIRKLSFVELGERLEHFIGKFDSRLAALLAPPSELQPERSVSISPLDGSPTVLLDGYHRWITLEQILREEMRNVPDDEEPNA